MAGAPLGNNNAAKGKRWANAIDKALGNRCKSDGQKALVKLAEKLLEAVDNGEGWALKELGDRLDGKPAQAINVGGQDGNPVLIGKIARPVIDPNTRDTDS